MNGELEKRLSDYLERNKGKTKELSDKIDKLIITVTILEQQHKSMSKELQLVEAIISRLIKIILILGGVVILSNAHLITGLFPTLFAI